MSCFGYMLDGAGMADDLRRETYVWEENTGDTAFGMKSLLVAFLFVTTTVYATLVACYAVLVRLNTA